jgi:hypothetical protein
MLAYGNPSSCGAQGRSASFDGQPFDQELPRPRQVLDPTLLDSFDLGKKLRRPVARE